MEEKFTPFIPTAGTNLNHAEITSPSIVRMMINRAKNPVIVVGENLDEDEKEIVNEIIETFKLKCIRTPEDMNLIIAYNKIVKDKHDLVLFIGITYYYLAQTVSYLKNFSNTTTVSIDRYYHPNVHYSFPNLEKEELIEYLKKIL
ncbi:carbon monoxide dehydrogenase beta subunit family protein [Methanocaldococcus indicus]|uniref:carbon monoxide dehydrogenase beta subunit family protein n=1 Tax=Methanocaldococcus indicus TaxID=213231 RepID=UPI003C6CCF06